MKKVLQAIATNNVTLSATPELEEKAAAKLNAGQYKEAIELYKTLYKQTRQPDRQDKLAFCYCQRALILAQKGMLKEAIVMWGNYALNAKPPYQKVDCYILWQLQNNNFAKVQTYLRQLSPQQIDEQYSELATLLGLLIISGQAVIAEALPQDCQLLAHAKVALGVLQAYRNNQSEATETELAKLPFRSAFRDFRTLMKAVLLLPVAADQAQSLLNRTPVASPYQGLAAMLLSFNKQGAEWVNALLAFDAKQRKLLMNMKSLSKKQEELINYLAQQKNLTDKVKFTVALKYQDIVGAELSKHFCQATLATYPGGQSDFNKAFKATNAFEAKRIKALNAAREGDTFAAEDYWLEAIDILKAQPLDRVGRSK